MWSSLLLFVARVEAGACCGATGAMPARLDVCDSVLVGIDLTGETSVARWTDAGTLASPSPLELGFTPALVAGVRITPTAQVLATAPIRMQRRWAGATVDSGFGAGDLRVQARWTIPGGGAWPMPTLFVGARLPTGTNWQEADGPLLADVTGEPGLGLQLGAAWEGVRGDVPFHLDLAAELPVGGGQTRLSGSAGIGRALGREWTIYATLSESHAFAAAPTDRSAVGLRLVHGRRLAWRAWAGVASDLAIPGLGRGTAAMLSVSAGAALVR